MLPAQVGDAHHEIQKLDSHRQQRREEWNAEFERQLAAYSAGHGGDNYLYQLPEHCVKASCWPTRPPLRGASQSVAACGAAQWEQRSWSLVVAVARGAVGWGPDFPCVESSGGRQLRVPPLLLQETTAEKMVVWVGVASMLLQLVAAYVALSLSVRLPGKRE